MTNIPLTEGLVKNERILGPFDFTGRPLDFPLVIFAVEEEEEVLVEEEEVVVLDFLVVTVAAVDEEEDDLVD